MKRYIVTIVSILVFLTVSWVCFGQAERGEVKRPGEAKGRGERWRMRYEEQLKAVATIEEQIAKVKSSLEERRGDRRSWQDLSDEEREKRL